MKNGKNFVILTLLAVLIFFVIKDFSDPEYTELTDVSKLEKTIADQQKIIDEQKAIIYQLETKRDTLVFIETQIKYMYEEIYRYNSTANVSELDSVIRVNVHLASYEPALNSTDSLACYTREELNKIGDKVVRANECDTLLQIANRDREYANEIIHTQNELISAKDTQLLAYDQIVTAKNADIAALQEELFHQARKKKWIKGAWVATGGILGGLLLISVL